MNYYIERLVLCGYTNEWATDVYFDFMRNFSIAELEIYVGGRREGDLCGCTTTLTRLGEIPGIVQ